MISLIDPQESLGCSAEAAFADMLDIPRMRIAGSLSDAVPRPTLREDLHAIMAMGGQILVAQKGSVLVPVPDTGQAAYAV
jgi:hypothetical protein